MEHIIHFDQVLQLLEAGQTVLVPTTEAAQKMRRLFDLRQEDLLRKAWEAPHVLSWAQWLEETWHALALEGQETRVLLNRLQEESLWVELAPASGLPALPSSTLRTLARQASSGLALAAAYRAVRQLASAADSPDTRIFVAWHRAFEVYCHTNHLLSRALLSTTLAAHWQTGLLAAPPSLHMVGFEQLDPSQGALLDILRQQGSAVHLHLLGHAETHSALGSCTIPGDLQDELRWAVLWLRQYLEQNPNPLHPVALVLPDPEKERTLLEPLLRELLAPELESVAADLSSAPWHFSTGPSLASQTILAHALELLRWTQGELPIGAIGTLLLSPYLAHTDSFEARARFDMQTLRRSSRLRPEMTLSGFLKFATSTKNRPSYQASAGQPLVLDAWRNVSSLLAKGQRTSSTHGDWAEFVRKLLQAAGWPGPRTLSPTEFRLTEAWESVLDLLATLDLGGVRVTLPEFLALLQSQLEHLPVQGCNPAAPVQILRPSETEGLLFQAALVVRATDGLWPMHESTHPLLGWALQKSFNMPGTSAFHSRQNSLGRLRSLQARSSVLLLTAADHDATGPLRMTGLAAELALPPLLAESLLRSSQPALPVTLESFPDKAALPSLPSNRIAGGARVLELQASCGFRAFASLRLNANSPETRKLGGDARESGQDLHKTLEIFWQQVQSQQALLRLSPTERHAAVAAAVLTALEARKRDQPLLDTWSEAYLDVAARRLTHVVLHWLESENLRSDFTVLQQEEKQLISVGPLELSIRPDRIDQVDGGLIFVDYKTSQALSNDDWIGDRPAAPQLPLYALLAEPEEVRGLAFARVRAGNDMGWISLQSEAGLFPRKGSATSSDFVEQVALWQRELARLAEEFAAGSAQVDPKTYPKTCEYCQQRLLCRLDPDTLLAAMTESSDPSSTDREDDAAS